MEEPTRATIVPRRPPVVLLDNRLKRMMYIGSKVLFGALVPPLTLLRHRGKVGLAGFLANCPWQTISARKQIYSAESEQMILIFCLRPGLVVEILSFQFKRWDSWVDRVRITRHARNQYMRRSEKLGRKYSNALVAVEALARLLGDSISASMPEDHRFIRMINNACQPVEYKEKVGWRFVLLRIYNGNPSRFVLKTVERINPDEN
ncbi:MAG TPA: hypothetical protein VMX18_01230 [Candidatus Bipolaricaulota bacterium]|nr:hypothetical protein [Candidatus Bipolaricaulota bacterium]